MGNLAALLKKLEKGIQDSPVSAQALAGLVKLIKDGTISGKIAKAVFEDMAASGKSAEAVVKEEGLVQIADPTAVAAIIDKVIAENPKQAEEVRSGKAATLGWFVGQVMKASAGKANPGLVNQILKEKLK